MEELISIVIVAYKSEATILDTLESIKRQSYKNWEIVLADDCSPDDTVKVFKEWVNSNNLNSRAVLAVAEKILAFRQTAIWALRLRAVSL